jgi:hypothetical protein
VSNLGHSVTLVGEYNHLITGTRLCIGHFLIELVQVRLKLCIYWGQREWGWHSFFPFSYLPYTFPSILLLSRKHSL